MSKMVELTSEEFVKALASKAPVPGGGGVAAMVGSYAAALSSMVGNLTLGRKKYAEYEEENIHMLQEAEELSVRLLELVDLDAKMFEPLSKAYSLPKDTPDYDSVMEKATLDACTAPLEMMETTAKVIDLLARQLETGSKLLQSDVGCGAYCAKAALECASLNVFINTKLLKNRQKASEINNKVDELLNIYTVKAEKVASQVALGLRENN